MLNLTDKGFRFIVRALRGLEMSATTEADRTYARKLINQIEAARLFLPVRKRA